jgi:hypothetical protein
MKRLILIMALLPGLAAAAEQQKNDPQKKKMSPVVANPCAQYGDGFVQLKGTNTCVKLDGSVRMEMGGRVR